MYLFLSERSFKSCLLSWFFLWHLLWLSVMQLRHYLFIGTLNPMLNHLAAGHPGLGIHTHTHITQTLSLFILMSSYLWAGEAMPLSSMNRYRHANRLSLCHVCKLVSLSFRHFLGCEQSCCFCSQSVDTQMRLHLLSCVGSCVPPGTASSWTATKESSENQVNI